MQGTHKIHFSTFRCNKNCTTTPQRLLASDKENQIKKKMRSVIEIIYEFKETIALEQSSYLN